MSGSGIPEDVSRFVSQHIHSVEQLEVLLLVRATAPKDWGAQEVARELRIDANSAAGRLEDLESRGLVSTVDASAKTYRYSPASLEQDRVVRSLADTYGQRRVAVITLIFSKPSDTIRSFADAFRIKKKED